MQATSLQQDQFEELITMLRAGYEAGALRNVEIEYPGVGVDTFPAMNARLSFSSRPSNSAYTWVRGTLDQLGRVFSRRRGGTASA